jgi:acetyl esterase/lipase
MKKIFAIVLFWIIVIPIFSQKDTIILWPGGAPGALGKAPEDIPVLICYHAKNNPTHAAILVCPGGGYITLAMDHEGKQIAEWFNANGVSAYILKYRVNSWDRKKYAWPSAFNDASRAMRYIRYRSKEWNLDTYKIGIIGFSAGGHLASTMGTHFDTDKIISADPIDRLSARPSFMILCYPVISIKEPYMHSGCKSMLLGNNADTVFLNQYLSNETQVKPNTPPTFIFQTNEDKVVPAEHAVSFYLALRKAGIPVEMHIFEPGPHGVGLAQSDNVLHVWPDLLKTWLKGKKIIV